MTDESFDLEEEYGIDEEERMELKDPARRRSSKEARLSDPHRPWDPIRMTGEIRHTSMKDVENALSAVGIPPRYWGAMIDTDHPEFDFDWAASYYIYGPVGTGKTHMLCGMLREHAGNDLLSVKKIRMTDILDTLRAGIRQEGPADSYLTYLAELDYLGIDDIGAAKLTEWGMEQLFSLIDHRYEHMLPTYITSNVSIDELQDALDRRIASRIQSMCQEVVLYGADKRAVCRKV